VEVAGSPIRELRAGQVTDRRHEHDWAMAFTIRDKMVVRHRHSYDTADVLVAFQA
jgi:hypothetical protein